MCFNTLPTALKAKKATKNIVAYKVLNVQRNGTVLCLKSPMRSCTWDIGKLKTANLALKLRYKGQNINVGLHCCKTAQGARNVCSGTVVPVIIPKGAYYYENRSQYVSNKMFIVSDNVIAGTELLKSLGIIKSKK